MSRSVVLNLVDEVAARAATWNANDAEVAATYPCDALDVGPSRQLTRAIDVTAPVATLFDWVCQLRAAPYSYDWIDNLGRRSPRTLTPGLSSLEVGQGFLIATIESFERDRHITGLARPEARKLFGVLAITYWTESLGPAHSRLVVRLCVEEPRGMARRTRAALLAWGDLVMMRKQLLTIKRLAERAHA
jgi:hypothetical protein